MTDWVDRFSRALSEPDESQLGRLAVQRGFITQAQLDECLRELPQGGVPIGAILVKKRLISVTQLSELLSEQSRRLSEMSGDAASKFLCGSCGWFYSIIGAKEGQRYRCRQCDRTLMPVTREQVILASDAAREQPAAASVLPEDAAAAAEQPDRRFGRFIKIRQIGEGASGTVWLCYDADLSRYVGLKFLSKTEPGILRRFLREANIAAKLRHPNIVTVHDVGSLNDTHYIVMDYIEGESADRKNLDAKQAIQLMERIADAVDCAHRQSIIHRDIKPANIIIASNGTPYLVDFGLARPQQVPSTLSVEGLALGTPHYMSPEQARGEIEGLDGRADIYGLGATLYHLLTGRPPFDSESLLDILKAVQEQAPPSPRFINPALSPQVEAVVSKSMEKDPSLRYKTAAEFCDDLRALLQGRPPTAVTPSLGYRFAVLRDRLFRGRKKIAAATLAAAAALLVGILIYVIFVIGPRESRANRLIDEAANEIDKWEIHLYLEASELAPRWDKLAESMRKLDEALQLRPASARALYYKAKALNCMWQYDEALALLSQAIELEDNGAYRLLRAQVYEVLYLTIRFDQFSHLQAAAQLAPDADLYRTQLVADIQKATALGHLKPEAMQYARALLALGDGRFNEARAEAQALLDIDDKLLKADAFEISADAILLRAAPGDALIATDLFKEALRIKQSSFRLYLDLAVAYRQAANEADGEGSLNFLRQAEEACRKALAIARRPKAFAALGEVLIHEARRTDDWTQAITLLDDAIAQLSEGLKLDPQEPVLHLDKGTAHYERYLRQKDAAQRKLALHHWQRAIDLNSSYRAMLSDLIQKVRSGTKATD